MTAAQNLALQIERMLYSGIHDLQTVPAAALHGRVRELDLVTFDAHRTVRAIHSQLDPIE